MFFYKTLTARRVGIFMMLLLLSLISLDCRFILQSKNKRNLCVHKAIGCRLWWQQPLFDKDFIIITKVTNRVGFKPTSVQLRRSIPNATTWRLTFIRCILQLVYFMFIKYMMTWFKFTLIGRRHPNALLLVFARSNKYPRSHQHYYVGVQVE